MLFSRRVELRPEADITVPALPVAGWRALDSIDAIIAEPAPPEPASEPMAEQLGEAGAFPVWHARVLSATPRRPDFGVVSSVPEAALASARAVDGVHRAAPAPAEPHAASPATRTETRTALPSARQELGSVRLRSAGEPLPTELALFSGDDAPVADATPALRTPPAQSLCGARFEHGDFVLSGSHPVEDPGAPQLLSDGIQPPAVSPSMPQARSIGHKGAMVTAPMVRHVWRAAEPASSDPVEYLGEKDSLLACEYRTRMML